MTVPRIVEGGAPSLPIISRREAEAHPRPEPGLRSVSRSQIVTPVLAPRWLDESLYDGQRKLTAWHLAEMVEYLNRDEWEMGWIVFAVLHERWYLVNGQHTLNAIIQAGKAAECVVTWRFVSEMPEVARVYRSLDVIKTRTIREIVAAGAWDELVAMSRKHCEKIIAAAGLVNRRFQRSKYYAGYWSRSNTHKFQLLTEWADEGRLYFEALSGCSSDAQKDFTRSAVMGIALVTLRECGGAAWDFWYRASHKDGLEANSPEERLGDFLARTPYRVVGNIDEYAARVAAHWNGYADGRRANRFFSHTDKVELHGTGLFAPSDQHRIRELMRRAQDDGIGLDRLQELVAKSGRNEVNIHED
jgi:hypothetical protein